MIKSSTAIMAVAMLVGLTFAQSPMGAPVMSPSAPATDCITTLTNVSDCLSYVQVGSNLAAPDKKCCPEFAGLLESNPICLCQLVGNAEGFGVDISRALMLPDACKLTIPSLESCPAPPVSAPAPSPSASDGPGSTAAGPGPDGGTALTPAASGNGERNGASSSAVDDLSTLICLAVAIFIAYYF